MLATVKGDVHDIGKNLVDIILTNNGYEVHNLGIKVAIAEMIEKAHRGQGRRHRHERPAGEEHADHAREPRGAEQPRAWPSIPVLLGGAALTRTYVERDLREVYEGRLFYGKDAFEGLHVMDRLGEIKRDAATDDPDWGRVPSESTVRCAAASSSARRRAAGRPARPLARRRRPTTRSSCRRSSARKVVKGIALDDIAAYINETALFRNQWQFRPDKARRERRRVQGPHPPDAARRSSPRPRPTACSCPQVVYGYFPANGDGDDLVIWNDETRTAELAALLASPASARSRTSASPTSSGRSTRGEVDYAAFHIVTMGAGRVASAPPSCSPPTGTRSTCCSTASASRWPRPSPSCWHRRIREEWGFADEDGPTLAGLFRQQYRGGRYSWGYPACPDLEDNEKVAELLDADRIGIECQRGDRLPVPARADHLAPSSATTPRPSTSSPGSRRHAPPVGSGLPLDRAWARVDSQR